MNGIFHSLCRGRVVLNLNDSINLFVGFGISTNGIVPGHGELELKEDPTCNFFCTNCKKPVPHSALSSICYECGNPFPADRIYKVSGNGGLYCDVHSKQFSGRRYLLSSIIERGLKAG